MLKTVARAEARARIGIGDSLPFEGYDVWNAYEISWLDERGKPEVATGVFIVPCDSPRLVESKSLKLHLNALNQTRHASAEAVRSQIEGDLSERCGARVRVELDPVPPDRAPRIRDLPGTCIDGIAVAPTTYDPAPELLQAERGSAVTETLHSHLLKTNCSITGQPDWASVLIRYHGPPIDHTSLLLYLISFRNHREFHEPCVERMFMDLLHRCEPSELTVYARYTRRGGLDINPFRSSFESAVENMRLPRQ